jgi:RNA polymerase sigma-70 factor, ECF subfamily
MMQKARNMQEKDPYLSRKDDEASLVLRACALDEKAVAELYERHVQAIYRYVIVRVNDHQVAEDITADVFLRAVEGLGTYEYRGAPFSAWLYRIARDRVVDYYRQQGRQNAGEIPETLACSLPEPDARVVQEMEQQQLRDCLQKLTEDQRMVVLLRFIERQSADEIARRLGKTAGAVRALQHRALMALSHLFEGEGQ